MKQHLGPLFKVLILSVLSATTTFSNSKHHTPSLVHHDLAFRYKYSRHNKNLRRASLSVIQDRDGLIFAPNVSLAISHLGRIADLIGFETDAARKYAPTNFPVHTILKQTNYEIPYDPGLHWIISNK